MKPIDSTAEILFLKMMDYPIDKRWVDWAYKMLCAGFETEDLIILAGEIEPYNQFELKRLTDKVLKALNLKCEDKELTLRNYTCYLVGKAISGETSIRHVLRALCNDCLELNYDSFLYDFYLLYWAYDDLTHSENQYYWEGATRDNINDVAMEYFRKWKAECKCV